MKLICKINFVLITALAVTAGVPKLARIQNEVDFFAELGLGSTPLLVFGGLQLAGGLLMVLRGMRTIGAVLAATMFAASTGMLVATGQVAFGLVSLVPVAMSGLAAYNDGWTKTA